MQDKISVGLTMLDYLGHLQQFGQQSGVGEVPGTKDAKQFDLGTYVESASDHSPVSQVHFEKLPYHILKSSLQSCP